MRLEEEADALRLVCRGHRGVGGAFVLLGVLLLALVVFVAGRTGWQTPWLVYAVALGFAMVWLILGGRALAYRAETRFDSSGVEFRSHGLIGSRRWRLAAVEVAAVLVVCNPGAASVDLKLCDSGGRCFPMAAQVPREGGYETPRAIAAFLACALDVQAE